jgi:two-component system, NtrC family, sensor kinase
VGIIDPVPNEARETRSLRTIGLLTRGALHEISNPLVGLLGSAELALGEAEPGTKLYDRVALARRTGSEIADIVRALQGFIRLQELPAGPLSLGHAAAEAVALVDLVLPTVNVTLTATGDAGVVAAPGEVQCSLVELLVAALERSDSRGEIALTVRSEGPDAVVTATGGGELRLPAAQVVP